MNSSAPGDSGQGSSSSTNACLPCRKVKMKCRISQDAPRCDRCVRKSLDCEFQQHRRGRKVGTRLNALSPSKQGYPADAETITGPHAGHTAPASLSQGHVRASTVERSRHESNQTEPARRDFWADSNGFQPPSLLNRQAARGNFSLQNVLSTSTVPTTNTTPPAASEEDPITKGLVNRAIATSLYQGFMANLNPLVCQFDPLLHTFEYVRSSPFLFSAMLAAAAKSLNPSLQSDLRDHAESLFAQTFRRGNKSASHVQAILILTYWKEPDDTRAFVNVGLAIRMAMELGWHKLAIAPQAPGINEYESRKTRNIERTWLVLFVYDRSISLQTGRPWMIERGHFVDAVEEWYRSPLATSCDGLLCAFVSLRLLTDVPGLLDPKAGGPHGHATNYSPLMKTLEDQILRWQKHWSETLDGARCHLFLISFYGAHTLLLLSSVPLQSSLSAKSSSLDMGALWISYNAVIRMLELVADDHNTSSLYFAQDSVHVMIAYAAVFLIKLLFSVRETIRREIEIATISSLRTAARIFSQQGAPLNTGCALQSKFLANVVHLVENACQRRVARETLQHAPRNAPEHHAGTHGRRIQITDTCEGSSHGMHQQTIHHLNYHGLGTEKFDDLGPTQDFQIFEFDDNEMWSDIFASAGFAIDDGTFLPDMRYNYGSS